MHGPTARGNVKELQSIINASRTMALHGTRVALATVVNVSGSSYRRAGARMLVAADGRTAGSISGGCLERDVRNQAQRVLQWNMPRVVTYDSMSDDDIAREFNLGCQGIIDVLIEPLAPHGTQDLLAFLSDCLDRRLVGIVATVFCVEGMMKTTISSRLMLSERQSAVHDIGDDDLAEAIEGDSRRALHHRTTTVKAYEMKTGRATVFIEVIHPPIPLVIFGGGQDAVPLVRFAKELGWHITVVDPRPGYLTRTQLPLADTLIVCRPDEVHARIILDDRTMAVVMTHNFLHDAELLRTLLPSPIRYLGLLGPKLRSQRLLHEVRKNGGQLDVYNFDRVYGPVGLDIGAETPEEIALAIVAEIQTVLSDRSGGMLRTRKGPLHEQRDTVDAVTISRRIQGMVSCGHGH
jgi:xanthine/CO dehydrogenase XdhC/CoxF family maturation factor